MIKYILFHCFAFPDSLGVRARGLQEIVDLLIMHLLDRNLEKFHGISGCTYDKWI